MLMQMQMQMLVQMSSEEGARREAWSGGNSGRGGNSGKLSASMT
jgi:hypothetical protein